MECTIRTAREDDTDEISAVIYVHCAKPMRGTMQERSSSKSITERRPSKIAPNFVFQFLRNALAPSLGIVRFFGSTGRFREARLATGAPQTRLGTATSLKLYWR